MDAFADLVLLGKGTYGRVYKAVRVADGMTCVVKVVRIDAMTAEERAETFNESRVLEALTHRHVVACLDAFIDEARQEFCIVMEYAAGGDLGARITAQHGVYFAEETLWAWLMQLLDGLGYLHGQRVLHRDLKPQNIFLDDADDILIGDLGLGRILGSQSAMAYTSVGTPLYFSPEICEGRPYDDKSDVWGLGCLMYELAALVPPFTATNQVALAQRIVGEAPAALPQHYSMEFQFVVFKMLEKDVGRRPDVAQLSEFSCIVLRRERERLYAQSLAMQTAEEELRAQVRQRDLALDTLRRRASEESRD